MGQQHIFSNLMVWGDPLKLSEKFDLFHIDSLESIKALFLEQKIKVLIFNRPEIEIKNLEYITTSIKDSHQDSEIILVLKADDPKNNFLISTLNPFSIIYDNAFDTRNLEESIIFAIQRYDYHQQNLNFYLLFQEQSEQLQKLNEELEDRVRTKNLSLKRSQSRLLAIKEQLNLMYECILGIQKAKSIPEIEDFLTDKLFDHLGVKWIRSLVGQKEIYNETMIIEGQDKFKIFGTPLYFGKKSIGHIYFAKLEIDFKKKDESFLLQLSEIVSIKINQLVNYNDLVITQSQWQQTFKAIQHKVTVVDSDFNLLNTNFDHQIQVEKRCHMVLFNSPTPCQGCQVGKKFEIEKNNEWHKVTSQKMKDYEQKSNVFINIYQNVTEQKNIEMKIIEKTRLSDLGILAGSLAHELNNPLAGIITFLQLILSDKESLDNESQTDIQDLLDSALDCKHVIQSILESVKENKSLDLE